MSAVFCPCEGVRQRTDPCGRSNRVSWLDRARTTSDADQNLSANILRSLRLVPAFSASVYRFVHPVTTRITLRYALTNRFRHFLDPRYHCSTSHIQPRHRRCRIHRPFPSRPAPLFSHSAERILVIVHACIWPTKCSPSYFDVPGAVQPLSAPHSSVPSVALGTSDAITVESTRALLEDSSTSSPPVRLSLGSLPQEFHRHRIPHHFSSTKPRIPRSLITVFVMGGRRYWPRPEDAH